MTASSPRTRSKATLPATATATTSRSPRSRARSRSTAIIFGDVHIENVTGPMHSAHFGDRVAAGRALPGDLTLNSDDLRVTEAKGAVRVTTRAEGHRPEPDLRRHLRRGPRRQHLDRAGRRLQRRCQTQRQRRCGSDAAARRSATVDGRTRNGDIVSDYGLSVNGDESKSVSGHIGSGESKITLNADVGDLRIKKGSGFPPVPPNPPAVSAAPNAPHLRAPKAPSEQPVTQ